YPDVGPGAHTRCCAPADQYDARRTADMLGIPHFTFDRRELFQKTVVGPFVHSYLAGETPSPCAAYNRGVKIAQLTHLADRLHASQIATAQYDRRARTKDGTPHLSDGVDRSKDQSLLLYATPLSLLGRLTVSLGDITKAEVRAEAFARRLTVSSKGERQELCFVGVRPHSYAALVEEPAKRRLRTGPIVD